MKILYPLLLVLLLSSCAHRPSASRGEIINVDIAAIEYRLTYIVAIYPTEVFTWEDAALVSVSHSLGTNQMFFDSLEALLPPKVKFDEDFFVNKPRDARVVCLITYDDHTVDMLWFGGPYTVYRDVIYEFDRPLAELVASKIPEPQRTMLLEAIRE